MGWRLTAHAKPERPGAAALSDAELSLFLIGSGTPKEKVRVDSIVGILNVIVIIIRRYTWETFYSAT